MQKVQYIIIMKIHNSERRNYKMWAHPFSYNYKYNWLNIN